MAAIGTQAWCEATNGHLTAAEKVVLAGMLVRAQARQLGDRLRSFTPGWRRRLAEMDLARVPAPDTRAIRDAETLARDVYGEPLRLHCYRTYWWAALLAQFDALRFDAELLLVAALLHDLGLAPRAISDVGNCCFATNGARQAAAFAHEAGWDARRKHRLYEAISLHLNPVVDARLHGAEAKLIADGATFDVIGSGRRRIPDEARLAVHSRFPRAGFRDEIVGTIERRHAPGTRPAFLAPGFAALARRNPLDRKDSADA